MKIKYSLSLILFWGILLISACADEATITPFPTRRPPTQTPLPTATIDFFDLFGTPTPTVQVIAPVCEPCPDPVVPNTSPEYTFCESGKAYQSVDVEAGARVVPMDTTYGLGCVDSGMRKIEGGYSLDVWTCTGEPLRAHKVTVINAPCRPLETLELNSVHCTEGMGYSAAQNCCAPLDEEPGSAMVKLNMGACK